MRTRALALGFCAAVLPARADEARDLLFASAEIHRASAYGGAGWMHAPQGLDIGGLIFAAEVGRPFGGEARAAGMAGWRIVSGRLVATGLVGAEIGSGLRPVAAADLWWDEAGLMASARVQASTIDMSARAAIGWRLDERWPWLGPEIGWADERVRLGVHATGLRLFEGVEARASAGWLPGGAYGELSLWRRF